MNENTAGPIASMSRQEAARGRVPALALLTCALVLPLGAAANRVAGADPGAAVQRQSEAAFEFARAKLLAEEGAFDQALKAFERTLELDPNDPYSRIEVAELNSYLAQLARSAATGLEYLQTAARYAGEALRLEPENLEILRSYAQIHLRLGERQTTALDQALQAYEKLRAATEGDLQVLTALGQVYLWQQQWAKAAEVLEEATSYRPGHRMILTMLLDALLKGERLLDAEGVLDQLIELDPTALEYRLQRAELQSSRGAHRAAAAALSAAPEDLLRNPRLRQVLAQELHLGGANEEALALTDALRNEASFSPGMRRLRVAILSSLTRYDEAITELEPLLAPGEDTGRAAQDRMLLSRLLERTGRLDDAAQILRQGKSEADPPARLRLTLALSGVLERQGLAEEAVGLLRREVAAAGEHLPMLSLGLSELLARMDRAGDGLEVLEAAVARLKADGQSEAAESLALRRLALLAAAEDWPGLARQAPALFEAVSLEVRAAAEALYAEALAAQGRVDDALGVLSAEGGEVGAQNRIGRKAEILYRHGRAVEARALLTDLTASGDGGDLFFAAQVFQRLELYSESIPLLERLLEQQVDSPSALFLLGAAQERAGEHAQAIATFRRLLDVAPDHAPTLNYLGYMWAELGENLLEAVSLIRRAVALDPDNGAYVDSLGWAYFQLGRFHEARGHLEWAARLVPDDATILVHLGDLYVALEDLERARASYRQALDLGGDGHLGEDVAGQLRRKLETLDEKGL